MDSVLAFAPSESTLFRQRVTPLGLQPPFSTTLTPGLLTNHLNTDHLSNVQPPSSSTIAGSILNSQTLRGFTSDQVVGKFMVDFNPAIALKKLTLPTIGAAWNLLEDKITSFYYVTSPVYLVGKNPAYKSYLSIRYDSYFDYLQASPKGIVEFGKTNQKYRVIQPTQLNTNGTVSPAPFINSGLTQSYPNVYEVELRDTPNMGQLAISFSASPTTKVREFTLTGDLLPAGTPGFFNELDLAVDSRVQAISTHMETFTHYGIKDDTLGNTSCLSTNTMSQRYSNSGLSNGAYGGDAWLTSTGVNNAHPLEEVASGTLVYWIALYNGEEAGKRVTHPTTGEVLARPVNGKKRIRCAFTLPAELTPLADAGVLLRRCNPTLGYKVGLS